MKKIRLLQRNENGHSGNDLNPDLNLQSNLGRQPPLSYDGSNETFDNETPAHGTCATKAEYAAKQKLRAGNCPDMWSHQNKNRLFLEVFFLSMLPTSVWLFDADGLSPPVHVNEHNVANSTSISRCFVAQFSDGLVIRIRYASRATLINQIKHNRLTSGELLSNDRRAIGFVSS